MFGGKSIEMEPISNCILKVNEKMGLGLGHQRGENVPQTAELTDWKNLGI